MRVCHIVRQFHPSVGGLENFVSDLAREQTALGCACEVLTLDRVFQGGHGALRASEVISGLMVRRAPMIGHRRFFIPMITRDQLEPFDVLHVHGIDGMFDRLARHPRRPGQALVATSHGGFFHTTWMRTAKTVYFNTLTRLSAQHYDVILANSASDRERLLAITPRVALTPNGVKPLGDFVCAGRDLLCLGRLASHKHIDRLLITLAEPVLADTHLHIVGPEWDVKIPDLLRAAADLGIADRVTFHGRISRPALQRLAVRCGLFVSASRFEGFGMSMIEAMSVGLVPVVEANPSFRELLLSTDVGALTHFATPHVAAAATRRELDLLSDARRARAMRFAERFSWRAHAERTLDHYVTALRQPQAAA
jgi:alpha-1,3-mannosyltransferase